MKKKGNELLYGSFFVLKLSIVAFRPQAPHKTTRSHFPHDRTSGLRKKIISNLKLKIPNQSHGCYVFIFSINPRLNFDLIMLSSLNFN
jgi:hypothetical protein